jgi:hypothetical protein
MIPPIILLLVIKERLPRTATRAGWRTTLFLSLTEAMLALAAESLLCVATVEA